MPLIDANEMPAPRLELRWIKTGETWSQRDCAYNLVLPLRDIDIRREDDNGEIVRNTLTLEIGRTRVKGGFKYLFQPNEEDGYQIGTPYRDCAHAMWDSNALCGIPVYAVFEEHAMLVPNAKLTSPQQGD